LFFPLFLVYNAVTDQLMTQQKLDKEAKVEVDEAVEEAKKSPEPAAEELWTDIYFKGTEPAYMRGREREEIHYY
jgi:pyruvate dehydrogenase E1 component alpha subunit